MPSEQEFKAAMASFATGVTVITAIDEDGTPYGLTATAFSSVSKEPPTCLVCVSADAEAYPIIHRTRRFGVNILSTKQSEVSTRFATSGEDKFGPTDWDQGPALGLPVLPEAIAAIECTVSGTHRIGDHTIFYGTIESVRVEGRAPLLYFRGQYGQFTAL